MTIKDLMIEEKGYLEKKNEQLPLSDLIRWRKISEITSIFFNRLAEYSESHSIEELEEYKKKMEKEEIFFKFF
jgi:hypothetical protein